MVLAGGAGGEHMEVRSILHAGVDWATERHQLCVLDEVGQVCFEGSFAHSGVGLERLCARLSELASYGDAVVRVAIEVPRGAVVETLLERGHEVFVVNPKQLDRFRDRFTMPGAKDDRLDAMVLASALRTDRERFRQLRVDDPAVITLRERSRMHEELTAERKRLANRLRRQLRRYFPQFLELHDDVAAPWVLALWRHVPAPAKARKVQARSVARLLKEHRVRKHSGREVLAILKQKPLHVAPGTVEAAIEHIEMLIPRLELANSQLKQCRRNIEEHLAAMVAEVPDSPGQDREQHDVTILSSLPGVGPIVLAVLLAEASGPIERRDYHALRSLSGVAPVTRSSGKKRVVSMRHGCSGRLRNAVFHWASVAAQHDELCKARYEALRARGHKRGRALRTVGDRLLRVACAMLENGTTYTPAQPRRAA